MSLCEITNRQFPPKPSGLHNGVQGHGTRGSVLEFDGDSQKNAINPKNCHLLKATFPGTLFSPNCFHIPTLATAFQNLSCFTKAGVLNPESPSPRTRTAEGEVVASPKISLPEFPRFSRSKCLHAFFAPLHFEFPGTRVTPELGYYLSRSSSLIHARQGPTPFPILHQISRLKSHHR